MYSLAVLDDDQDIFVALSRSGQVVLQSSLPAATFSEHFPALLQEHQVRLKSSDRLVLLAPQEEGLFRRLWGQRREIRWLETRGLEFLSLERMEPGQALAARAFQCSEFSQSAVLCFEKRNQNQERLQLWWADQSGMRLLWRLNLAPSLALFLEQLAHYSGFKGDRSFDHFHDLASYGEPRFVEALLHQALEWSPQGHLCRRQIEVEFPRWLGGPARQPEQPVTAREIDLSASLEALFKQWAQNIGRELRLELKTNNICLTGAPSVAPWLETYLGQQKSSINVYTHSGSLKEEMVLGASLWRPSQTKESLESSASLGLGASSTSGLDPAAVGRQHLSIDS